MSLSPSAAPSDAAFDFEQLAPPPRAERPPSMDEAHDRARAIIAAAEAQAESIREHARREGYAEGMVAGRAAPPQAGRPPRPGSVRARCPRPRVRAGGRRLRRA